ncbi:DUF2066 domain-containing protein [Colwellia sp. BRX10-3]|uniref:DUF2066 domain-containing protein n=1 Tax=Colwellia sp. BRX10-3 TaxID=2759844 RepID=UPI0015F58E82|nr:DUF2066 domain-containing protein [Colwellia sp. BRX10-3]MBA6392312.1 DUF2066 domain-containing protein [Colwellia sp. BRX10-3]
MKHMLILSMFRNIFRNCLIFLFFVLPLNISAIEVGNLYSAKVAVASQSNDDRNQALQNALRAVLVKIGGKEIEHPLITQAIKNYNNYVTQYQYIRSKDKALLNVAFDEDKINQLFKESDLAIWGRLRPQVMVWLIEENGFKREIISSTSNSLLPNVINDFSQLRGLPLVMPIMDLTDLTALTLSDVWGRFSQPVAQASARYMAEAVVVIRVSNSSLVAAEDDTVDCPLCQENSLAVDWSLMTDAQSEHAQIFSEQYLGDNIDALLITALSDITDIIYQQYALSTTNSNEFQVDVANIASLAELIAVSEFLKELSAVQSVQLISVQGTNRRFKLSLIGSQQALFASLKLSEQLNRYIDPLAAPEGIEQVPVFYWSKK